MNIQSCFNKTPEEAFRASCEGKIPLYTIKEGLSTQEFTSIHVQAAGGKPKGNSGFRDSFLDKKRAGSGLLDLAVPFFFLQASFPGPFGDGGLLAHRGLF
jgi:hypothetical protein